MKTSKLKSDRSVLCISLTAWLVVFLIGSLIGFASVASAQTQVSGTIVNQTWNSNNSPYVVVGNINVAGLTILPDVTVQFASNYTFEVDGVLQALGTPSSPIIFKGTNSGWQGIFFNYSSPGSVLACCVISNSINSGINILSSSPAITDCVIANNKAPVQGGGIYATNSTRGNLVLEDCIITNNIVGTPFDGTLGGDVGAGGGVAVHLAGGTLVMKGCLVSGNVVNPNMNNFGNFTGGGVAAADTTALLSYCG
jgi:predicted outer membrane repeat protein